MKEVTLSIREQKRLMILNRVEAGGLTYTMAAGLLGLSLRQIKRLRAAYRKEGAAALVHGNRGRTSWRAIEESIRRRVVELAETVYAGCNQQHFTELLAEREGIMLSRSSVRRILLWNGIKSHRKRRAPKHRRRRERYPQEGMLLQIDGSRHDWLEGRGPWLTLIGAIDDATGKVPHALFRYQEDAQGYFLLLRRIVARHGIPIAVYRDGHGIFERSRREPETREEQLEGKRTPTQFGRLLEELGTDSLHSHSPQARGRIERLWGTFQDRLVSELRLAGVRTIDEANQVLNGFLAYYNRRFAVSASQPGSAYRRPEEGFVPAHVFCFKYYRTVGADNVVPFGEHRIQLLPTNNRTNYARARVEVHEGMDGSIAVYYQGNCLVTKPAPPEAPVLRARNIHRGVSVIANPIKVTIPGGKIAHGSAQLKSPFKRKPSPDHPWRRPFKIHIDRG